MLALLSQPQPASDPYADPYGHANMSCRSHPYCIACHHKQAHVCNESDKTACSAAASLSHRKLDDASPAARETTETLLIHEALPCPSPLQHPPQSVKSTKSTKSTKSIKPETPKALVRSCLPPGTEPPGTPNAKFSSYPFASPDFSLRTDALRARIHRQAFPGEWPRDWEQHPRILGLLWMHRPWSDGTTEYLLYRPDVDETRTYFLPPGGSMYDFTRDPWGQSHVESMHDLRMAPPRGFHGLESPTGLSDSSGETVIGEAPDSACWCAIPPKTRDAGLGIWAENALQLARYEGVEESGEGGERRRLKKGKKAWEMEEHRRREKEEQQKKKEKEREKRERKKKEERKKQRARDMCFVTRNGKDVFVSSRKNLGRY